MSARTLVNQLLDVLLADDLEQREDGEFVAIETTMNAESGAEEANKGIDAERGDENSKEATDSDDDKAEEEHPNEAVNEAPQDIAIVPLTSTSVDGSVPTDDSFESVTPGSTIAATTVTPVETTSSYTSRRRRNQQSLDEDDAKRTTTTTNPSPVTASSTPAAPADAESPYMARARRKMESQETPRRSAPPPISAASAASAAAPPPTCLETSDSIPTKSSSPPSPRASAERPYAARVRRKVANEVKVSNPLSAASSVSPVPSSAQQSRPPEEDLSMRSSSASTIITGMGDGDRMFALLQTDSTPDETTGQSLPNNVATAEEGNQIVMGALRSVQSPPAGARRNTGARPDMRQLPMERQGSFIDGGAGPLTSEDTPGAFRAQGRAFGATWGVRGGPAPQTVRTVPPAEGSHHLPAETLDHTARSQQPCDSMYSVVEAQLVESQTTLMSGMDVISELDMRPASPDLEVAEVIRIENTISKEEENRNRNCMFLKVIVAIVVFLSLILVVLAAVYFTKDDKITPVELAVNTRPPQPNRDTSPPTNSNSDSTKAIDLFPLDGNLPMRNDLCTHDDGCIETLEPILQCYCTDEIMNLSTDHLRAHKYLFQILFGEEVLALEPLAFNCSDPQNLALLWLIENEVLGSAPQEELVRQYVLALMFHSWDGLGWTDNSGWLSTDEECNWLGITCNDEGRIISVNLPNNGLSGTVPSQMGKLQDLQEINLSGNLGLTGPIPSSLMRFSSWKAIDVEGTSINL